mmetsp:Transcript_6053/g.22159  ORF Transcript_6053/g.22159 Transcript_6053/m.22159 type:complete len:536 (-) Transcript_6053:68-1675(-)
MSSDGDACLPGCSLVLSSSVEGKVWLLLSCDSWLSLELRLFSLVDNAALSFEPGSPQQDPDGCCASTFTEEEMSEGTYVLNLTNTAYDGSIDVEPPGSACSGAGDTCGDVYAALGAILDAGQASLAFACVNSTTDVFVVGESKANQAEELLVCSQSSPSASCWDVTLLSAPSPTIPNVTQVWINTRVDVTGFQFYLQAEATATPPVMLTSIVEEVGLAAEAGFQVESQGDVVLGVAFDNAIVPTNASENSGFGLLLEIFSLTNPLLCLSPSNAGSDAGSDANVDALVVSSFGGFSATVDTGPCGCTAGTVANSDVPISWWLKVDHDQFLLVAETPVTCVASLSLEIDAASGLQVEELDLGYSKQTGFLYSRIPSVDSSLTKILAFAQTASKILSSTVTNGAQGASTAHQTVALHPLLHATPTEPGSVEVCVAAVFYSILGEKIPAEVQAPPSDEVSVLNMTQSGACYELSLATYEENASEETYIILVVVGGVMAWLCFAVGMLWLCRPTGRTVQRTNLVQLELQTVGEGANGDEY